ncbi:hypothetical protein Tfer_2788 [Thermincola ferriacetica]|uniref:Uncharacterized protein n=1 Tax=Thermincola ferriacetica TaxID=281456 RepID=A0A0L6W0T5_9FIRM|nr:hypothetical protein Tfer_2788 [Thermincola ferriacetica]
MLGDVFGNSPTDGRMALNGSSLSKEVRAALDAAGIPKEGSTYLINKAYGISGVQLAWQKGTGKDVTLDRAIIDYMGGIEYFVSKGYTSFNTATPWGPGGIATLTLSNPSGSGRGSGGGSGGGGGGGGRTLASTEYHGTVSVSKTPKYVFTAWHRRPSGELCDMKVDVSWSNFRKVVYYSDGSSDEIPVEVTKVEAYHVIERYDDKGQMYVWPVETLASSLGSSGHVKHLWQYERAGKPGSMVYYLLRLETGDAIEVTFEVPVNGFSTTYLNPDEAETMADKVAPTWWCSPRDSQTVSF